MPTAGRRRFLVLPAAAATSVALSRHADAAAVSAPDADADQPLGIGLEGWPYPHPLHFHPVQMSGQRLRMGFMDILPAGSANGRTVVLLHGKNFDSSYWAGPIGWLSGAGFRVLVPDQIGFNSSAKPALEYRFADLAHNTMALLDSLSIDRAIMLGHSTGGALAVTIGSLFPARIERIVLEDPIGLVDYRQFIPPQSTETLLAAEYAYTEASYRAFIAHFFHSPSPERFEPFVRWRMRVALSGEFDRFALASALTYQMIYSQPTAPLYAALPMPVLLTAGEQDRSTPLIRYAPEPVRPRIPSLHEAAASMARTLERARFVSFAACGHVPHLEQPDRFRDALFGFLRA